jgi:hypothetical protein
VYIRVRTDAPVSVKGDALTVKVSELHGKPVVICMGMEPSGYPDCLTQQKAQPEEELLALEAPLKRPTVLLLEAPVQDRCRKR